MPPSSIRPRTIAGRSISWTFPRGLSMASRSGWPRVKTSGRRFRRGARRSRSRCLRSSRTTRPTISEASGVAAAAVDGAAVPSDALDGSPASARAVRGAATPSGRPHRRAADRSKGSRLSRRCQSGQGHPRARGENRVRSAIVRFVLRLSRALRSAGEVRRRPTSTVYPSRETCWRCVKAAAGARGGGGRAGAAARAAAARGRARGFTWRSTRRARPLAGAARPGDRGFGSGRRAPRSLDADGRRGRASTRCPRPLPRAPRR